MSGCLWSFLPLPIMIALYSIIRQPITHFMTISKDVLESLLAKATALGVDMTNIVMMKNGAPVVKDGLTQLQPYGQINLVKVATEHPELAEGLDKWINMDYGFIGLDLTVNPWDAVKAFEFKWAVIGLILIPILAGGFQLLMTLVTMRDQPQQGAGANSTKTMMYMMPLMSVYIAFIMPAALGVYWIAQSVFSMIQEWVLGKFYKNKLEEEEAAHAEAIQADRQRRIEEGKKQQEQRRQQEAAAKKQTLREKQQAAQAAKAAKAERAKTSTTEAGRVGERPYARGRSYKADRYDD